MIEIKIYMETSKSSNYREMEKMNCNKNCNSIEIFPEKPYLLKRYFAALGEALNLNLSALSRKSKLSLLRSRNTHKRGR